jgi:uncharacterized protein (UPF0276 family)
MMLGIPYLGHGVGLRTQHYQTVLADPPATVPRVDWFEIISENFMVAGGNPRRVLRLVRERHPVVMHGVSLSIGSTDALDARYLDELAALAHEVEPAWISDHLCWSQVGGQHSHDLLPLPYTEEALAHVAERILRVQDRLRRRILIENVSSYVAFTQSTMTEWQFLTALCERADCGLLLDVNNVFVSAFNHGFSAEAFIDGVPAERVGQVHLAGHSDFGTHKLDTHDHAVCEEVWQLYRRTVARCGRVSTLVEWDDRVPPFEEVVAESRRAAALEREVLGGDVAA